MTFDEWWESQRGMPECLMGWTLNRIWAEQAWNAAMIEAKDMRPAFRDPVQDTPPSGKLILLTNEETCIIGKWGEGVKGWQYLPKIPDRMKRGGGG